MILDEDKVGLDVTTVHLLKTLFKGSDRNKSRNLLNSTQKLQGSMIRRVLSGETEDRCAVDSVHGFCSDLAVI